MKEISLYIHIPFCKNKCFYCDFTSFSSMEKYMPAYIEALEKEIKLRCSSYKVRSLFIGGGTPSYLNVDELKKLMEIVNNLRYVENAEKTMECNPGTLNEEKISIIKKGGINRLSFGLQSTQDRLLKKIGRIHNYNDFIHNYFLARSYGFNNINVDIMFGLPTQTIKEWEESLNKIIEIKPEHISAYSLIVEENTPFYTLYNENKLQLPSENEEREMYHLGVKILENNGYNQYEISNFAQKNKECFHNKIYWQCEEYIGVGLAASSYINNTRIKNVSKIEEYIKKINENTCISIIENVNTKEDNIEEFMFMGLRMIKGVKETDFMKRFGVSIDSIYKDVINKNIAIGLLERNNGRIYLTKKGIELSNTVMSDMIL
ncbi:MAG: oxygen-independent coproporphyrinogen III oxidase [Clostridiales bacterium]|nr:oxygen-independent coproporphyrinogen III oxidase [Clostridiales bacterium]